jgi:hypothetical protein
MATDSRAIPISGGDIPVTGKEIDVSGSASDSEIEVHKSNKGYREGTTFATHGLRQDTYRPVDTYEGIHRFDPDFEWEPQEERKIVRKVWHRSFNESNQIADLNRLTSVSAPGCA